MKGRARFDYCIQSTSSYDQFEFFATSVSPQRKKVLKGINRLKIALNGLFAILKQKRTTLLLLSSEIKGPNFPSFSCKSDGHLQKEIAQLFLFLRACALREKERKRDRFCVSFFFSCHGQCLCDISPGHGNALEIGKRVKGTT